MFLFLVNLLFVNSVHVGKLNIEKSDNFPPTPTVASDEDVMPVEPLTRVGPCTEELVGRTVPINQLEDGIQVLHFDYRGGSLVPWQSIPQNTPNEMVICLGSEGGVYNWVYFYDRL
jgi:hypothetical protein